MNELSTNNLFKYATSELSQDAFICWFLSHALKENLNVNAELTKCAMEFIKNIKGLENVNFLGRIERQVDNIDVLIEGVLSDESHFELIIEDKTFTNTYKDQIAKYKEKRLQRSQGNLKIFSVLYKIVEQCHPEQGVDFEFTRANLLKIMKPYKEKSNDSIFKNYVEYLEYIDNRTNSYKVKPISEWDADEYRGFFNHLINDLKMNPFWWGYVPNQSGGFQCFCWNFINGTELDLLGITEDYLDELYLQLQNDVIALKMSKGKNRDLEKNIRGQIFEYFQNQIPDFERTRFAPGNSMTIGRLAYDEKNYKERIQEINRVAEDFKHNFKIK